ncbi:MAG: hypothetical protein RLZZ371_968, partial [Pseudomonadota bacterium]
PSFDPSSLTKRLAKVPALARRKPSIQHLHNVYFDTPAQVLRQKSVALRLRRVGNDAKPTWLQTLKTGGGESALSQRGEWEAPVSSAALTLDVLEGTPWSEIDPDGTLFQALTPSFATNFERTSWLVRQHDGSEIEVALDLGQIVAGDTTTSICELELELLAGQSSALFDLAQKIALTIPVMPLSTSKSERGYALAANCQNKPLDANPPKLASGMSLTAAATRVLRENFCQFTTNLNALRNSDDPELVHQARVGWRRFSGSLRLFKPVFTVQPVPAWQALKPLLIFLGELRDLDVALTDTLPPLADAFIAEDNRRSDDWQAMTTALLQAACLQRKSVRYALDEPTVGATLLTITQWLEELSALNGRGATGLEQKASLQDWARRRLDRLHRQLKLAGEEKINLDSQHRVRILAKRLRYGIETLRPLLPKKRAKRWYQQATKLQSTIGRTRDVMQASSLVAKLETDRGLVEFLRGVAVGHTRQ